MVPYSTDTTVDPHISKRRPCLRTAQLRSSDLQAVDPPACTIC